VSSCYRLIEAEKTSFPIHLMCRMLGVSRSGYYAWRGRPLSARDRANGALTEKIRQIHERSRCTYGSPRVHAELRVLGIRCSRKRVERLMRQARLQGCVRGRRRGTTRRGKGSTTTAEDLLKRSFAATEVDKVWVADITYVATSEGLLYLAFILDVHSRRIVGWAMESHLRTELVVDALRMAVWRRKPAPGLVHHSDQGVQYTSLSFSERLREVGIKPSMGRTGSALDNAMAESFVSTLKAELVSGLRFPSRRSAKTAIFEYLETFYNTRRLHSSLGYRSPADFENDRMGEARVA
jgi:putative transposase